MTRTREKNAADLAHENANRVTFQLTVNVTYDLYGAPKCELREMLERIPRYAADEGWFTGSTAAEVDDWSFKVEEAR